MEECADLLSRNQPGAKTQMDFWRPTSYDNTICCEHRTISHENCGLSYNESMGQVFLMAVGA
jgi:hypothetical protein